MAKLCICANCGKEYRVSFGGWANENTCKECFTNPEARKKQAQSEPELQSSSKETTPRQPLVPRFPALEILSGIFVFVGWAGVVLSAVCALLGFIGSGEVRLFIVFGALGALMSLIIVAIGEWTKVFLAIEENTRKRTL